MLTLTLALLLLAAKAIALGPTFPKECRAGCTNCVFACYAFTFWNPVFDCSQCQKCVLTPIPSTGTRTSASTEKDKRGETEEIEVPGCGPQPRDDINPEAANVCAMVCGHGIDLNCWSHALCLDDEGITPGMSTTPWPHIATSTSTTSTPTTFTTTTVTPNP
jgi:hypothetical protein